jgi:hypothetical protein
VLAGLAVASSGHRIQVTGQGLRKIRYQPRLAGGCRTGTGRSREPDSADIMKFKICSLVNRVGGLAAGQEHVYGQHRGVWSGQTPPVITAVLVLGAP